MRLVLSRTQYLMQCCDVAIFVYTFICICFSSLTLFFSSCFTELCTGNGMLVVCAVYVWSQLSTRSFATNSNTSLPGLCARFPMWKSWQPQMAACRLDLDLWALVGWAVPSMAERSASSTRRCLGRSGHVESTRCRTGATPRDSGTTNFSSTEKLFFNFCGKNTGYFISILLTSVAKSRHTGYCFSILLISVTKSRHTGYCFSHYSITNSHKSNKRLGS